MDIQAYLSPIKKWWRLLVIVVIVAIVSSSLAVFLQPPTYISRTTIMIGRNILGPNPDSGQIYAAQQLASIYADMAMREPIQDATMNALGIDWLPVYTAVANTNSQFVEIHVTDTDPQRAQIVANEIANQLILQGPAINGDENEQRQAFIKQQLSSLQTQIQDTELKIEELQSSLGGINSASQKANVEGQIETLNLKLIGLRENFANLLSNSQEGALNNLTIVEPANLPEEDLSNKFIVIILAAGVGFFLAVGAAYLLEYLDKTVKTTSDVEKNLGVPVIGYITSILDDEGVATYVLDHPYSATAESFRLLQSNLEFLGFDSSSKTILVTSPNQGDGKTTVAVNLAILMAQSEQKVILVDADMRRPAVHTALGINVSPGLSEMIRNRRDSQSTLQTWERGKLDVLTVGSTPPNVTEVVGSKKIISILDDLADMSEVVIVDAPPLVISDAYNLASRVDGVVLVLEPGQTTEEQAQVIREQLKRSGAKLFGVVFNKVKTMVARSYGDYQFLSMYSPQRYADYVSNRPVSGKLPPRSGKLLAFFEHGELPPEVEQGVQSAITAIRTQPRNIVSRIKKKNRKNGKNNEAEKAEENK